MCTSPVGLYQEPITSGKRRYIKESRDIPSAGPVLAVLSFPWNPYSEMILLTDARNTRSRM